MVEYKYKVDYRVTFFPNQKLITIMILPSNPIYNIINQAEAAS